MELSYIPLFLPTASLSAGCIRFFAKFVVKSVRIQQKFAVKGVIRLRKFVAFLRFGGILTNKLFP